MAKINSGSSLCFNFVSRNSRHSIECYAVCEQLLINKEFAGRKSHFSKTSILHFPTI